MECLYVALDWRGFIMNIAIRDLTFDELERVVGGDAQRGAGAADDDSPTCVQLVGFYGRTPILWPIPCPWLF
jgi:hypothetical protein